MRNIILKTLLFGILMVLVNSIYLLLVKNFDWNFRKRIEAINLDSPQFDLLILGNSLPMDGIDAELLSQSNIPAYNLAIGGATIKTNYIQLKEYLSDYEYKPKYVILGLGSYIGGFDDKKIHPIVDYTRENYHYSLSDMPILKFKWLFIELLKKIISKEHRSADLVNGQLRFDKVIEDNTSVFNDKEFPLEMYNTSEEISSFLKLCEDYDITLIVAEMPGFKKFRHKKLANCLLLDEENINGFLLDFNNIEFGKKFADGKDWLGDNHLNETGARKFTQVLVDELKKIRAKNLNCIGTIGRNIEVIQN